MKKYDRYQFIWKSIQRHGYYYDYRESFYKGSLDLIDIICPIHGKFQQVASEHIRGRGCRKCGFEKEKSNFKDIQDKIYKIFGSLVTIPNQPYINQVTKIKAICKYHGLFYSKPSDLLNGHGCPFCKMSQLERNVMTLFEKYNITFEAQKSFEWLRNGKNKYFLDFYLPQYNIAIECQGRQHFKPINFFGGQEGYEKTLMRDKKKLKLCNDNNIQILYYTNETNINEYNLGKLIFNEEDLLKEIKSYGNN